MTQAQMERELQKLILTTAIHEERIVNAQSEIKKLREDFGEISDKVRDDIAELRSSIAIQTAFLDDLKKRWEESDRRRWTVYGVMLAATLTFAANLVLMLLRK